MDLHVHSHFSPCSRLGLADILAQARARGLEGVGITDHQTRAALGQVREGRQPDGLLLLVGQEYATPQGDFLLYGPLPELPPDLAALELLERVAEAGGAAIAAHPFRPGRSLDPALLGPGPLRLVEGINGRNPQGCNQPARQWAQRQGLGQVGGSDAHSLEELGGVATRLPWPVEDHQGLVAALHSGLCQPLRLRPAPSARPAPVAAASDVARAACL